MKNKIIFKSLFRCMMCLAIYFFFQQTAFGQKEKSEISLIAGGTFSSLGYDLQQGNIGKGNGGLFGLRYAYYLSPNWSLGTGVEYGVYNSTATLGTINNSHKATDSEGESFEFRYRVKNYREEQRARFVQIPLNVQYETSGAVSRFYVSVGAKIALPMSAEYQVFSSSLSTSGYYPQYNVELFDPRFAGFGDFGNTASPEQDLKLKTAYIASIEFGLKQKAGEKSSLYIGFYLDYGLNDIYDGADAPHLVGYSREIPSKFSYHSLFETGQADNLKVFAFGIKLRYALKF